MKKKLTRRQFLALLSTGAAGAAWLKSGLAGVKGAGNAGDIYLPLVSKPQATPTPKPTATVPPPTNNHRVVRVHSNAVTSWVGSGSYWDKAYVDQAKVNDMVANGMMALTGKNTVAEAWRTVLPGYQAGQGIAIKVNFNNSIPQTQCAGNNSLLNGLPQPANAVIDGLHSMGVRYEDIWFYDGLNRDILPYFYDSVSGHNSAVKFYGKCHLEVKPDPGAVVNYSQGSIPSSHLADVLVNATYLINMPILKGHYGAIFTAGFKNHFGTIDNPGDLHRRTFFRGGEAAPILDYSPLVDIFKNVNISGKTILTIGEGIYGAAYQDEGPITWATFGNGHPKSLLFSIDPVAIDTVMADLVDAEWQILTEFPNCAGYLVQAQDEGLGVTGSGDPHRDQSYNNFDYRIVNL